MNREVRWPDMASDEAVKMTDIQRTAGNQYLSRVLVVGTAR